jgi:hypothetical protein
MRDFTNLGWPEAPFGAPQRPFGHHADMLAAFAVEWTAQPENGPLPVAAATIYLRLRRRGTAYRVDEGTLPIGFRAVVIDDSSELPELLAVTDRGLTRARRHAAILAGHRFDADLTRMATLSSVALRGVDGVLDAWAARNTRERGMALMVDTSDASASRADLDMPFDALPAPVPQDHESDTPVARVMLARCLAVGLSAALHAGRYRWENTFRVTDAVDRAAWDVLSADEQGLPTTGRRTGRPTRPAGRLPMPGVDRR